MLYLQLSVAGKSAGAAGDFYNWDMDENDVIDMNDVGGIHKVISQFNILSSSLKLI